MNSIDWMQEAAKYVTRDHIFNLAIALSIFVVGRFLASKVDLAVNRLPNLDHAQRILFSKIAKYAVLGLTTVAGLNQLGIKVEVILGAAGVLTVAIGFAAQTSTSNLISGLFLMIERPFVVGDIVAIGDIKGVVTSVDLLSSKIRTFTNLMVRIPNETMVKSNITNLSFYPVKRVDFDFSVSPKTDIAKVEQILRKIAHHHPLCLVDPEPIFVFKGFADSGIALQFLVYAMNDNQPQVQNDFYNQIKLEFDRESIEFGSPIRSLLKLN